MNPIPASGASTALTAPPAARPMDPGPEQVLVQARLRLAASRQRLQAEWVPVDDRPTRPREGAGLEDWLRGWRDRARDIPVVGAVVDAAAQWWQNNPWRLAGQAVAEEAGAVVLPWVRRHPVLSVAAAAGLGYAVVAARPWTWPTLADRISPTPRRIGRWLWRQVSQAPLQSILAGLLLSQQAPGHAKSASGEAPHPATTSTEEVAT